MPYALLEQFFRADIVFVVALRLCLASICLIIYQGKASISLAIIEAGRGGKWRYTTQEAIKPMAPLPAPARRATSFNYVPV